MQPFGESIVSQREKLIKKQFVTRLSLWSDPQKNQNEESGEGVSLTIDRQHGSAPPTGGGYSVGDIVLVKHSHPPSRGVHIHGWGSVGWGLLWNIRLRVKKKT